ncbi:hypothetical protein D0T84_12105 [Dysgonomonas sp. 521]|uniref:hypothetical protein n=1 Tax=Dysgonomonas sp. 521 TaxID=2302932 RepID=UPI0013D1D393|nr:hypothetical protein [Dysgonomonas sp. 521]NDV95650.1 hypothetical protein [Dysgonomonas sp. 521]
MKSKSRIFAWLFQPFQFIAGGKALVFGLCIMLLLSIIGYLGNTHFNGVIGMQYAPLSHPTAYIVHIAYQVIALISMTAVFYITARVTSKSSVRVIDIAGTMSLSQIPHVLFGLIGLIPAVHLEIGNIDTANIAQVMAILKENIILMAAISVTSIIIIVWSIALKYNAYSVSGNIKGIVGGVSFAIALIVSEIISKILIYIVVPFLH